MSTAVISETEVLAKQQTIRKNPSFILKNQEEIKKDQGILTVIVKNQEQTLAVRTRGCVPAGRCDTLRSGSCFGKIRIFPR